MAKWRPAAVLLLILAAGSAGACSGSLNGLPDAELPAAATTATATKTSATSSPQVKTASKVGTTAAKVNSNAARQLAPSGSGYRIGPQDVLEIAVYKVPDLSKSVQVADTGTVNLPLVGEIAAAGRTSQQLERELTEKYGSRYLRNPQITVYVKEYNSRKVTVTGAVKRPGVYPIRGTTTLVSAVAMAGGLDTGSSDTIVVFRAHEGKRKAARFDIGDIQSGSAKDPVLRAGDQIVAGKSALKAVFGNVLKALPILGAFTFL